MKVTDILDRPTVQSILSVTDALYNGHAILAFRVEPGMLKIHLQDKEFDLCFPSGYGLRFIEGGHTYPREKTITIGNATYFALYEEGGVAPWLEC